MKCEEIRVLLAAYRRGEWDTTEHRLVSKHLAECNECRRWEVDARHVGEQLRQLPTIALPADFKDRVFAAIRADQAAIAKAKGETKAAVTLIHAPIAASTSAIAASSRTLKVVRKEAVAQVERIGEVALGRMRPPRVLFGKVTAISTVAALFAIIFAARFIPLFETPNTVVVPNIAFTYCISTACPSVPYNITAEKEYPTVTSVFGDDNQIVYVGKSGNGQQMAFLYDRTNGGPNGHATPLLDNPTTTPITLQALSSKMLVWSTTGKSADNWTLQATLFTNNKVKSLASGAITILSHGDTLPEYPYSKVDSFQRFWVDGQSILVVLTTSNGTTLLERIDVSGATTANTFTRITQASAGHALADPYLDGTTCYWVDKTFGSNNAPVATIFRQDNSGITTQLTTAGNALGPVASGQRVGWFQEHSVGSGNSTSIDNSADARVGTILTRASDTDAPVAHSSDTIDVTKVQQGNGFILWHDDAGTHIYSIDSQHASDYPNNRIPVNAPLHISAGSISWTVTSTDHSVPDTIQVIDPA